MQLLRDAFGPGYAQDTDTNVNNRIKAVPTDELVDGHSYNYITPGI